MRRNSIVIEHMSQEKRNDLMKLIKKLVNKYEDRESNPTNLTIELGDTVKLNLNKSNFFITNLESIRVGRTN
jgi:hypothetical protein